MSPSSSWANSVIPIVAVLPSTSTHSCSLEYLRPSGNSIANLLTHCSMVVSLPPVERQRNYFGARFSPTNFHFNGVVQCSFIDGHIGEGNGLTEGGRFRATCHATDGSSILEQSILTARNPRIQELYSD